MPKYHSKYIDLLVKHEETEKQNQILVKERDQLCLKIKKYDEILSHEINDDSLQRKIKEMAETISKLESDIQSHQSEQQSLSELKQKQQDLIQEITHLSEVNHNLQTEMSKPKSFSNDYMDSDENTLRNKSAQAKYESHEASMAVDDSHRASNEIQIIQNLIRQHDH